MRTLIVFSSESGFCLSLGEGFANLLSCFADVLREEKVRNDDYSFGSRFFDLHEVVTFDAVNAVDWDVGANGLFDTRDVF